MAKFKVAPSPRDRWPVREYVATEDQLVRMAEAAAKAWEDYHGCDSCDADVCEACAIEFAARAILSGHGPK